MDNIKVRKAPLLNKAPFTVNLFFDGKPEIPPAEEIIKTVKEIVGDGDDIGKLPELFLDVKVSSFPYDEKLTHYQTVGLGVFELSPKELCLGIEDKEYGRERLLEISKRLLRGERLTDSHLWAEKELPEHNRHLDEHLFYIELLFEEECAIREWEEVLGAFMRHFGEGCEFVYKYKDIGAIDITGIKFIQEGGGSYQRRRLLSLWVMNRR